MFDHSLTSQPEERPRHVPLQWRERVECAYGIGFDVGQALDPSAVAIVERRQRWCPDGRFRNEVVPHGDPELHCRHLQRFPLGESYTAQGQRLAGMLLARPKLEDAPLLIDATGCGRPVLEMLQGDLPHAKGVIITSSSGWDRVGRMLHIGKLPLISALQGQIHAGALKVSRDLPEAEVLANELANFRVSYSATGSAQFSARTGAHDDLILALALATWAVMRGPKPAQMVPTLGI